MESKEEQIEKLIKDKRKPDAGSPEGFINEVELQKAAYLAIEKFGDQEIRERVLQWEVRERPVFKERFLIFGIMLAIMVVSAIILYSNFDRKISHSDLFDEYFEPWPEVMSNRTDSMQAVYRQGLNYYMDGDYQRAAFFFESYLQKYPEDNPALFGAGISYLSQTPPDLEKSHYFLGQATEKGRLYSEEANWYLALNYLRQSRVVRAKKLLREQSLSASYKSDKAEELLNTLSFSEN